MFEPATPAELRPLDARQARQVRVADWCIAAFGAGESTSIPQRGLRLAEEAIEAAQAARCDRAALHRLVDYVYDRPTGQLGQELGGVGVTLLALASAASLSAEQCEVEEITRVLGKPLSHFAARNAAKNAAGFRSDGGPRSPASVLDDPATSAWLHAAFGAAVQRDPCDAARDARVLAELLQCRADAAIEASASVLSEVR